ncbi:MAG: tetratricopeptide repeat protein [bacterium]|nr:tetratricopeptide repeat protein [Candidatus Kapabacteria bacterium]
MTDTPRHSADHATELAELISEAWRVRASDLDRAEVLSDRIELLARERNDCSALAASKCVRAYREITQGHYQEAIDIAEDAERILNDVDDDYWKGASAHIMGLGCHRLRRSSEAREHFERAIDFRRSAGTHEVSDSIVAMGALMGAMGKFDRAIDLYDESLRIDRASGDREGEAIALVNVGMVHSQTHDFERAIDYYNQALPLLIECNHLDSIGNVLLNMGSALLNLDRIDEALAAYERALEYRRQAGNEYQIAMTMGAIGTVHRRREDFARALEIHRGAYELMDRTGLEHGRATILELIGTDLMNLERYAEAVEVYEQGLAIAVRFDDLGVLLGFHGGLSDAYEELGNPTKALEHARALSDVVERRATTEAARRIQAFEIDQQIEMAKKEAEIERLRNVELASALQQLEQAHRELKDAQAQIVHAEKMSSLGRLTAGIAHEINNPINFVMSSLAPLKRDLQQVLNGNVDDVERRELVDEIAQLIDVIDSGARRTAAIVQDLRTFTRLDEDELKRVDIIENLNATIGLVSAQLGGDVMIERRGDPLPDVECYPGRINQVFMHVLTNAIDAVESRGEIIIETSSADGVVQIVIADNGVGIQPEHRDRIFDPFFTTKDVGAGRGLGLATSFGIVRAHGGSIEVDSTPGIGSRFTIVLPTSFGAPARAVP